MNVDLRVIPHASQRYRTPGDWFYDPQGTLHIRVSALGNWKHELLIGVHELVEVLICRYHGVTQDQVDAFDANYERERDDGFHAPSDEPGDDPSAPYHLEHSYATAVERMMAAALGVAWADYAAAVLALDHPKAAM